MYKGQEYKVSGDFINTDIIIERIPVKGPRNEVLSVFVKISSGTKTDIALFESIDGSDWVAIGSSTTFGSDYGLVKLQLGTDYPTGTVLQLRASGPITVDQVFVAQNW
jgi:hypothetical protein